MWKDWPMRLLESGSIVLRLRRANTDVDFVFFVGGGRGGGADPNQWLLVKSWKPGV